jgi:hypothetical protein
LISILLIAIGFRFYRLASVPPGLHPDEAANGLDVFRILEERDLRAVYNTNGPREALFFYLQAIFVAIFGNTIVALRIAPALIGVAAVGAVYLLAKTWFNRRVGLISALLMAVTPWAVTMSRNGYRASMMMLFVPLTLWIFTLAYRKKSSKLYGLAGLSAGLGFYTYISFRILPFVLVLALGLMWWRRRQLISGQFKQMIISLIVFAITLIPLGIAAIGDPGNVLGARGSTSFFSQELNDGRPVQTLISSIGKTMLMFNVRGDDNFRHNLGGQPMLNFFVGIMFIYGLLLSIGRLSSLRYFVLLAGFGALLLPEMLTAEGIPHALRAIGALPLVLIIAAIGISDMLSRWYQTFPINSAARGAGLSAMTLLLGLTVYQGYNQYFVAWAVAPQTFEAYSEDAVGIANQLNSTNFQGTRYVIIDGYTDKTIQYLTHNKTSYTRIDPGQIDGLPADDQPKQFMFPAALEGQVLDKLKTKIPKARLTSRYSNATELELFFIYESRK